MTINTYILKFVEQLEVEPNRFSCLTIALRDTRKLTGRNLNTGQVETNILERSDSFLDPNSFIGIINYLLILDLIGEVFKKKEFHSCKNNIYRAIKQFGKAGITDKEIDTIIALRNSLAHNYGLINVPKPKERETKLHKFILSNEESSFLIKFPTSPWDGNFSNKDETCLTEVSISNLFEFIESIHKNLIQEIKSNNVELRLLSGIDELNSRFTIQYSS